MKERPSRPTRSPVRPWRRAAVCLGVLLLGAAPAAATVVSGQVTTTGGMGIPNIDIDMVDVATGMHVPLVGDDTDILGFYAVSVPEGTYDVQFEPPPGAAYVAVEQTNVAVVGASMTIDQVLETGFRVTARILDEDLLPFLDGTMDVRESATGTDVFAPNDDPDVNGDVSVVVTGGEHDFTFRARTAGTHVPVRLRNVSITADTSLGDIVLARGFHLTGRVVGSDGPALRDARVTLVDAGTEAVPTGGSGLTAPTGAFDFFVARNAYRLDVVPAQGAPYERRSFHGIVFSEDRSLPDLVLDRVFRVSGNVQDVAGAGIEAVDLDFDSVLSGRRRLTTRDDTDPAGDYDVSVAASTYDVVFEPPAGSGFAAAVLRDVVVDADVVLPDVVLVAGHRLSGRVLTPGGGPAEAVDVDVSDAVSGDEQPTPSDDTAADGTFEVVVPAGTWELELSPPDGSGWGELTVPGVAVAADTDLGDLVLPVAVTASPASVTPDFGPETGGTVLTISGADFQDGVTVWVGGVRARSRQFLGPTTVMATTATRPAGLVDLEIENPGAPTAVLPLAFLYERVSPDPVLRVSVTGPLENDLLLEWTDVGQSAHAVFRADEPWRFGDAEKLDVVPGTVYRDDGALVLTAPLTFYVVR